MADIKDLRALLAAVPTGDAPECSCGCAARDEACGLDCSRARFYYKRSVSLTRLAPEAINALPGLFDRCEELDRLLKYGTTWQAVHGEPSAYPSETGNLLRAIRHVMEGARDDD